LLHFLLLDLVEWGEFHIKICIGIDGTLHIHGEGWIVDAFKIGWQVAEYGYEVASGCVIWCGYGYELSFDIYEDAG
jgi:hypothetical protein